MINGWDNRSYLAKVGDGLSQFVNTLCGGAPDESLSGRSWRTTEIEPKNSRTWIWYGVRYAAEALFYIRDKGKHCQLAFEEDVIRSYWRGKYLSKIPYAVGYAIATTGVEYDSRRDESRVDRAGSKDGKLHRGRGRKTDGAGAFDQRPKQSNQGARKATRQEDIPI